MAKRVPLKKRIRRFEVQLQRNPRVQALIRGSYARYIRFVERTTRWTYLGLDAYGAEGDRQPVVFCTWHALLACTPFVGHITERELIAVASDHADGLIVVEMLRSVGLDAILVATSGDNSQSVRQAVRVLRRGATLGITTDGPMGPARQSKPGAVVIASLAGVPMVPAGYAARPAIRLGTWDRFMLPLPWGRGVMSLGAPIPVGRRLDAAETEALCRQLDAAIDAEVARCEAALAR